MNWGLLSKEERRELARSIDYILDYLFFMPVRKEADPRRRLFGAGADMAPTEESIAGIEEKFTEALLQGWDAQVQKAITKGAALVQSFGGEIDENEVKLLLNLIAREMGPGLVAMTQEQVTNLVGTAYLLGRRIVGTQLGIEPKLDLVDEQARQWLTDHTVFWIGDYYDRQLGKSIADTVRQLAVEQGLGREEVGRQLKALLGDKFARSDAYWRGLAATTVDRARNFGGVQSLIEAKVDTYEILPVGDERTCAVCMTMARHTFKVEHAVALRDAVLNAKTPEDIKKLHPWLPFDEVRKLDTEGAVRRGLALPPYHYHCRCTYIVSSFRDITVSHEPLPISFIREEPSQKELPPLEKLRYVGSGSYLGGAGEKHIYENKQGQKYIFKPAQSKGGQPEPFRAYVQEAASEIARRLYEPGQFVEVKAVTDKAGRLGTLQRLFEDVEGNLKQISWKSLTPDELRQIQREHVLDWVIGNFDSHGGNFIRLKDGRILSVDKEQAFRYINDPASWKMSLDYHPNAVYGEQEPIYNTIYRAFGKKEVDLDLQAVLPALQRLEAIPDEEYRAILRPYAEALHGRGEKAEKFLDLAVKRKHETREQFRHFFTNLLKTRDPIFKGTFKFADEMTGVELTKAPMAARLMTKEELEKLNVKALKEIAKAQKIKYFQHMTKQELVEALAHPDKAERISIAVKERVRARLEAAKKKPPLPRLKTPEGADIMEDFEQVPKTPFGVAVRKDGKKIEGQVINIRRIEDDGRPGFQLTMKIPKVYHGDVEHALSKMGAGHGSFVFQPGRLEHRRGLYQMGKGNYVEVGNAWYLSDQDLMIYFAGTTRERALMGQLEIRIYETDGVRAAKRAQEILKKLNLEAAIAEPTPEEERLLRLSRLAWQHAPREEYQIDLETRTIEQMERLLRDKGIDPARADKLVEREVWPGYKTFVDEGISEKYRQVGAEYLFAGVGREPETVVAILSSDSPGLMSTIQRYYNGIFGGGASQSTDIETGGADSAFVRLVVANARGKWRFRDHFKGEGYRLIFDIKELDRTDWYAYGHDAFGTTEEDEYRRRLSPEEFISKLNDDYRISNEIMLRRGIRKESVIGITCDTPAQKQALIQIFQRSGVKEINGKKLEDFIRVEEMI
ncbi:hypothetical protein [Thermoanaerobacterium sp. DL9XJH110]|uniref:hypothetical protein n=1 Tax=Thermoanaerobacterium sp. DL9XJH110 TaxID=3386643 RepID=UPI003BB79DAC